MKIQELKKYPGYFVTDSGRVFSKWKRTLGNKFIIGEQLREMKIVVNDGLAKIGLRAKDGRRKTVKVSHLVLESFVGPRPSGMEACHFPDRSPLNNLLRNLRWDTKSGNQKDRVDHGTSNHGERNGSAKFTEQLVRIIRKERESGNTYEYLAIKYQVSTNTMYRLCNRTTWTQVI